MPVRTINVSNLLPVILVWVISILLFVPVHPVMPRFGLDPSWILAANEAVAQRLMFGRDILYTVGPLSSIYTQAYHPATFLLAIMGGAVLAICHAFLVIKILRVSHWLWALMYAIVFIFLMESRDALFLYYPLLLIFVIYRVSLPPSQLSSIGMTRRDVVFLILSFSSLGLLPIIKLSFLPSTLATIFIGSYFLWIAKYRSISASLIALPVVTMVTAWMILGQNIEVLPGYFINNSPVIAGYTQAMSIHYEFLTPVLFFFSSLLVLYFFYRQLFAQSSRLLLLLAIALFLFISFKAGFVRHDVHALTASSGIVMAVLLLGSLPDINHRHLVMVCVMSVATWAVVHKKYSATDYEYYKPLSKHFSAMKKEAASGHGLNLSFEESYKSHLADIRKGHPIPNLPGVVDIYPFEQAVLIASGNKWSPRPAFQSFTAYTPELATANLQHLSGSSSPDNIVFSVNTIDDRYPSLDDGSSWPKLLENYELVQVTGKQLVLSKRIQPVSKKDMVLILSKNVQLGKKIQPSMPDGIIYAEIDVTLSYLGKIANILYKPTAVAITVELSNGEIKHHRFIPGEAVTGFIISPYIADTSDFAKLFQGVEEKSRLPVVNSITIDEAPFGMGMWNPDYSIKLFKIAEESSISKRFSK
jgi:hypothetical protein